MGIEGFEQKNSLSAEQQEKLKQFSSIIKPLIKKLAKTGGESIDADVIREEIEKFKAKLEEQGIVMSTEQIHEFIKGLQSTIVI